MPVEVESVTATDAPADVDVSEEGSSTIIRIGDPDVEVSGLHTYTLVYRVEGALNAFDDHDELYWNAIGLEWQAPIESARIVVVAPGPITQSACYQGYQGSTEPCARSRVAGSEARFVPGSHPSAVRGCVDRDRVPEGRGARAAADYVERWSVERAFSVNAGTVGVRRRSPWRSARSSSRCGPARAGTGGTWGRRSTRCWDAVRAVEAVPLGEGDAEAPVEFAPPEDIRPGQIGTLIDERANVIDVTATIVDLAAVGSS